MNSPIQQLQIFSINPNTDKTDFEIIINRNNDTNVYKSEPNTEPYIGLFDEDEYVDN